MKMVEKFNAERAWVFETDVTVLRSVASEDMHK